MILRRSFVHLPGIGPAKEKRLWERGLADWRELRAAAPRIYKQSDKLDSVLLLLDQSEEALERRNLRFFYERLPRAELWRLVPGHHADAAFLDIESTGMGFPPQAESTVIAVYFRGQLYQETDYSKKRSLLSWISAECSFWVTYFGETFDLPFLRRELGLPLDNAHVDLCFWLRRLGYKGGLKQVQKQFADIPQRDSLDIDGFDAVRLWHLHEKGISGALETLYTYNAEDTVVLEALLAHAYNLETARHPELSLPKVAAPLPPRLTTRVWHDVYAMLR
jgi:uncharacterized protein YprB with RNaseH-like and TPR domain